MWVALEQGRLSVHGFANKRDLRGHLELHGFRSHRVLRNLPGTPPFVQILHAWVAKSLFSLVHEQDVVLRELAVILFVPRSPRAEIVEQSTRACRVPEPLKCSMKQLLGALEIRVAGCDVVEVELLKLREKRQVRIQMSLEAIHAFKSRIDETEGHHRGETGTGVVKHGEFIHEITVGVLVFDCSRIALVGQEFLVDSELVAEERKLLLLGFEISAVLISEDEIKRDEPGSDVFGRVHTPETDILPANCLVQIA